MYKFILVVVMSLITGMALAAAKPCMYTKGSCLKFQNDSKEAATIKCNELEEISAPSKAQNSAQLDMSWGDGMGYPDPKSLYCQVSVGDLTKPFNFYNPYWGPVIAFHLKAENTLSVDVTDGWGNHATTKYEFDLSK